LFQQQNAFGLIGLPTFIQQHPYQRNGGATPGNANGQNVDIDPAKLPVGPVHAQDDPISLSAIKRPGKLNEATLAKTIAFHEALNTLEVTVFFDQRVDHQSQLGKVDGAHFYHSQNQLAHHAKALTMSFKIPG